MHLTLDLLRSLSPKDFASFGVNDVAYVKPATEGEGFAIHAADGTALAVVTSLDVALATIRQHDMEPARVQ